MGRRRRKGRPVHGWVIFDKPEGMTSTQAVAAVKRAFDAQKAGHAGTLDPLASGVLPIALGEATKTVSFLMAADKTYRFTACWGEARATDDREGAVTATSQVRPDRDGIAAAMDHFVGEIEQVPPAFSAIKVDGERAYDLARAGEKVALKARPVFIDEITLIDQPDGDHAVFEVTCGKGTYIRSLVRDMAVELGTVGHVSAIRRTRVGPFHEADAIGLSKLEGLSDSAPASALLRPVETALDDIPALALGPAEALRLKRGQSVLLRPAYQDQLMALGHGQVMDRHLDEPLEAVEARGGEAPVSPEESLAVCTHKGQAVAICRVEGRELKPQRVFNLQWIGDADVDYA